MDLLLRRRRALVPAVAALVAIIGAIASPSQQGRRHLDHVAFLDILDRVRAGEGLYEASIAGMATIGAEVDVARSLREPWIFWLWSQVSDEVLRWAFFLVVALVPAVVASRMVRHPEVGLLVGAWIGVAGMYGGVDAWLISELWCLPLLFGACLAWLRGRDGAAAVLCLAAMLIRETTVFLPLGFLLVARSQGRPLRPWIVCLGTAGVALAVHWRLAEPHLIEGGRTANLLGTGSLDAVADMTSFLVMPALLGLLLWAVGVVLLWRSALRPTLSLALLPLTGLLVNRPYWGFLAMPLCILALGGLPPWHDRAGPTTEAAPYPRERGAAPTGRHDP